MKALDGQTAVITGASRGIGRAVARKLASLGARVVINYARSEAEAEKLSEELARDFGTQALLSKFDVASEEQVGAEFERILTETGGIQILVNNAGIAVDGLVVRMKSEDWERTIGVNLSGVFYCSRAVAKAMMKQRYGRIINMSSVIGLSGNGGQTAYSAAKAGIFGFTKSLARELASRAVTVNAIAPGYIDTEMTGSFKDGQKEQLIAQIPAGRIGTVQDVAEAAAFLVSPGAGYITGQILSVNGGMYM